MFQIVKRRIIKLVTKVYDPLIDLNIGTETIKLPLSHHLTQIIAAYPEYNFNLARIVGYLYDELTDVKVIDIGANIGDTVAFIKNKADVPILCIDGEQKYMQALRQNTAKYSNVVSVQALVGAENKEMNLQLTTGKGTAYLEESSTSVQMRTLDNILQDFPQFKNSKVIKSDTDGYDTLILRACEQYLKDVSPVLFFEFDPHLIKKNSDDAADFINFLIGCNYQYFIFYTNVGDYLLSCSASDRDILDQLIQYFSGRHLDLFADICAFSAADKHLFEICKNKELLHFRNVRNFSELQ